MQRDEGATVHHAEVGTHLRSCTGPRTQAGGHKDNLPSQCSPLACSMGNPVNKHCFIRPFVEVKRMADTGPMGNKKTKRI